MKVTFTIPGTPRPKGRPRARIIKAGGRQMVSVYTDPDDLKAEAVIRAAAMIASEGVVLEGPVRLSLHFIFAPPKSWPKWKSKLMMGNMIFHTQTPDAENCAKLAMDGMNPTKDKRGNMIAGLWGDDSQVAELLIRKRWGTPARTEVIVETLDQPVGFER